MTRRTHVAIDIGASSGRHVLGWLEDGRLQLKEMYRFENGAEMKDGHLCWDCQRLNREIVAGLKACYDAGERPATAAIDTWGVDYVLLDAAGKPFCETYAYRDSRTQGLPETLDQDALYAVTGIQPQVFNTVYQLLADRRDRPQALEEAQRLLFMPEYLAYCLTGRMESEYTIASTSGLLDAKTRDWAWPLIDSLGLPRRIFGPLNLPGARVGRFTGEVQGAVGFDCDVLLPATHDTGSAFLAVPARDENAVYISSGTWSLLGVENEAPITGEASMLANFTNEGGYRYRYRYLKNIMGLWMIQSIRRELNGVSYVEDSKKTAAAQRQWSYAELEAEARECADFTSRVDVNDSSFLAPESMTDAVKQFCVQTGQSVPQTVGELMQCVYASLAAGYAGAVRELSALTGKVYTSINIVGGGSKDGYLNELTARTTGLPVFAGPTEGTALGNLMAQFIAAGEFDDLEAARAAIRQSFDIKEVTP